MATRKVATTNDRVLVVDDDPSIRMMVTEALAAEDYNVETASNGAEALAAIERESPAVMLLDMRMPVLDGWAVVETLQAQHHHRVPTVVMTAADSAEDWCIEARADACLGKPFDINDLLAAVAHAIDQ